MSESSNEAKPITQKVLFNQKQLNQIKLFAMVKQINGQNAFKKIKDSIDIVYFHQRMDLEKEKHHQKYMYVIRGEIIVYKMTQKAENSQHQEKVFMTSHKYGQVLGFNQYPLNYGEKLSYEPTVGTSIAFFSINSCCSVLGKILKVPFIQMRAEFLKKIPLFKNIEIEKLKRISWFCKKVRVQKDKLIVINNSEKYLFGVLNGEFLVNNGKRKIIVRKGETIGQENIALAQGNLRQLKIIAVRQSQIILIPKNKIEKLCKIKYRLQRESIDFKNQNIKFKTQLNENEQNETHFPRNLKTQVSQNYSESIKKRPLTSYYKRKQQTQSPFRSTSNFKGFKSAFSKYQTDHQPELTTDGNSLSSLCFRKYIQRKQKRQNNEVIQYLKSKAPELKLNPSKQFAVIKPLHLSNSKYIKNFKRKIKRNHRKDPFDGVNCQNNKDKLVLFFKEERKVD